MAKHTIEWALAIVLVLLTGTFLASQQFAIVSISQAKLGSDGIPYWVMTIAPTGTGEKIVYYANKQDVTPYQDSKGGKYVPNSDFSLTFDKLGNSCVYSLTYDSTLTERFASWIAGLFGGGTDFYKLSRSAENNVLVKISPSKGDAKTVNVADIGETLSFKDMVDGAGTITVQTLGLFKGLKDCPDASDVAIAYHKRDGSVDYLSSDAFRQCTPIGTSTLCYRNSKVDFTREFPNGITISPDFQKLEGKKSLNEIGLGVMTVTADARYLDYYYVPPTSGKPKIVSVDIPKSFEEGSAESIKVVVQNIGDGDAMFKLKATSAKLFVSPSSQNVVVAKGETQNILMTAVAGEVVGKQSGDVTFSFCSLNQFGDNSCDEKKVSFDIVDKGIFVPTTCGNGKCDSNENYATCPQDCQQQIACEGNHLTLKEGVCVCESGYTKKEDSLGREYCEQTLNLSIFIIVLFFIAVILVMLVIRKRMSKGRKTKQLFG